MSASEQGSASDGAVVIVPVKPPARGKSRLRLLRPDHRTRLATAFARDTVAAAAGAEGVRAVLVVTDDAALASLLREESCVVIPDGDSELNRSLVQAAAEAGRRWPGARPVVLLADLPCLTSGDLAEALNDLPDQPAHVRDRQGTGTTLYTAALDDFRPRFGRGSAAAHTDDGGVELRRVSPGLRLDVDDADDLAAALTLGVGPHTAAAVAGS